MAVLRHTCSRNQWGPIRISTWTLYLVKRRVYDGVQRFITLLYRPWFSRIWVIQEFALPRKVRILCGTWEMACEQVHVFSAMVQALGKAQYFKALYQAWPTETCNFLFGTRTHLGRDLGATAKNPDAVLRPLPLFRLLSEARAFEATDLRSHRSSGPLLCSTGSGGGYWRWRSRRLLQGPRRGGDRIRAAFCG